jgi:hypothetical protein
MEPIKVTMYVHGDPSVGIFSIQDKIELQWDLSEEGERERIREIFRKTWSELYDDGGVDVWFGDECPDCLGIGCHKSSCPSSS